MSDGWRANLTFSDSANFDITGEEGNSFNTEMNQIVEIVTTDHRELLHRDAENQHPISSIKNLDVELGNRVVAGNVLTNEEIEYLLGGD